ncbi:MAG: uracil-DNA glycosylase [Deltaproteobacteria bacterium]|nr:uracil-DNA glycosylase [Deltaproteobacteria bacterium]
MDEEEKLRLLERLYDSIRSDSEYRSNAMGKVFVPGWGACGNECLVFVGEAPGREEELKGMPFVGPAGKNLDTLLSGIGLARAEVFVTNLLKFRPLSRSGTNRAPSIAESRHALPFLLAELRILSPPLVVCLGLSAARTLLGKTRLQMSQVNGTIQEAHGLRVFVTLHPSPLNFRVPKKREALEDAFRRLRELSQELRRQ